MNGPDREGQVSKAFVTLADTLVEDFDVIDLLEQLVEICVELLVADAAGILLADDKYRLRPVAASGEDARMVGLLQMQADRGPSFDCYRTSAQVRAVGLAEMRLRWPWFADAAVNDGFVSIHALPLRLRGEAIGALNLFGRSPGPLPDRDIALGQALADVATIGILQERAIRSGDVLTGQLQHALTSRVIIEQASGILGERHGLGVRMALDGLRQYARQHQMRLAELAQRVVDGTFDLKIGSPARVSEA